MKQTTETLIEQYFATMRTTYESHKRVVTIELADVLAALRQNDEMRFELKKKQLRKKRLDKALLKELFDELDSKQAATIRLGRDVNKKLAYLDETYLDYQQQFHTNMVEHGTILTWRNDLFPAAKRWVE